MLELHQVFNKYYLSTKYWLNQYKCSALRVNLHCFKDVILAMFAHMLRIFFRNAISNDIHITRYYSHVPVMAREITELMRPDDGKVFIDMTFGGGGHTKQLLNSNKSITVIAVDRDPEAYKRAQKLASDIAIKSDKLKINQSVIPIHGKFSSVMKQIHLSGIPYGSVDGVIFDLGASSIQYDDAERGFSINLQGSLDMRMDTSNSSDITAEDVINNLDQNRLAEIFKTLGEEKRSRKIAAAIVDARTLLGRIKTTKELSNVIGSVSNPTLDALGRTSHPATKVFQALRIFVNNELNELNYAIEKIREFLKISEREEHFDASNVSGIAAVLSFHSLEDRIVKRHFSGNDPLEPVIKSLCQHERIRTNVIHSTSEIESQASYKKWRPIWKHVKRPSDEEIADNPRSRSAKLRAAVRVA